MAGTRIELVLEAYETSVLPLHSPTAREINLPNHQNLKPRPVVKTGE